MRKLLAFLMFALYLVALPLYAAETAGSTATGTNSGLTPEEQENIKRLMEASQPKAQQKGEDLNKLLGNGSNITDPVQQALTSIMTAVDQYTSSTFNKFQGYRDNLLAGLSLIALAWFGINIVLQQGDMGSIWGGLIRTIFLIGFAYFASGSTAMGGAYNGAEMLFGVSSNSNVENTQSGIIGFTNKLAQDVSGQAGGVERQSGTVNALTSAVEQIFKQVGLIFTAITDSFKNCSGIGCLGTFIEMIPTVFFLGIVMVGLLIAGFLYVVFGMSAMIMLNIAVIMAPIMIPWIVLERTSFLFDGWLRFLIAAALTKVVMGLLLGFGDAAFAGMAAHLGSGASGALGVLPSAIAMLVLTLVLLALMQQAPQIASTLISGGTVGMAKLAGSIQQKTMNTAQAGAVQGAKTVGNAASGTASMSAKGVQAAGNYADKAAMTGNGKSFAAKTASAIGKAGRAYANSSAGQSITRAGSAVTNALKNNDVRSGASATAGSGIAAPSRGNSVMGRGLSSGTFGSGSGTSGLPSWTKSRGK